jgi:hypothetical protein
MGNAGSDEADDYDETSNPLWVVKNIVKTALKKGKYDENEYMDILKRLIDLKSADGIVKLIKLEKRPLLTSILSISHPRPSFRT